MFSFAQLSHIPPQGLPRELVIDLLRSALIKHTDEETSACRAAADLNIFCRGFARLTDEELRERYDWIARKRPGISRQELESIANLWELAQQEVRHQPTSCDVQAQACYSCRGWNEYTDQELLKFYFELTDRSSSIDVVIDRLAPV